jgi:peptidyl-prolyl cis-trans isomerase SurA
LCATLRPDPSAAQALSDADRNLKIIAVVNDEVITGFDLQQRLNLIVRSSTLPNTPQTYRQLSPRVLQTLIDEALKLQEAKRLNVKVTRKEIDDALKSIQRQNKIQDGMLDVHLRRMGVDRDTLERQLRTAIAWRTVVRRRLARQVRVSDNELKDAIQRFKASANKPRQLVSEIFLAIDNPTEEPKVMANAQRVVEDVKAGANFAALARQFSQSASARRGGDLGWIQPGLLPPEVEAKLTELEPGMMSFPLRTATGVHIVLLRAQRPPPAMDASDTEVALRQIVLSIPPGADKAATKNQYTLATTIRETVNGCTDFAAVAKELGAGHSGDLGRVKVKELPKELRTLVTTIKVGVPSPAQVSPQGIRLIMVCDRKAPPGVAADRDRIRRGIMGKKLDQRARRYLRDLRQAAFIDLRA